MEPLLTLTSTQKHLWLAADIIGLVVVVVVAVLLSILVAEVATIHKRVSSVRETLKAAKANTADTALIGQTADGVEAVLAEGLEHHLFLGRVLEKVRS